MNHKAVYVENLCKNYKKVSALNEMSFEVEHGELYGIIGPDGAGKTSLFRILASLILPEKGNASLFGIDCIKEYKKIRKIVGYMPGRFSLYHDLSVEENLTFFATVFGTTVEENYDLIKDIYVQIEPFKKRLAGKLSGGMKQKLALSCALIHKPQILLLDEPTTGVDAVSRIEFWDMLKKLKMQGITILVSTPYMDEAILCDRVALIQSGKILQIDTPENITKSFPHEMWEVCAKDMFHLKKDLCESPDLHSTNLFGQYIHVCPNRGINQELIHSYLSNKGHKNIVIRNTQAGIEDCFIELMQKKLNSSWKVEK